MGSVKVISCGTCPWRYGDDGRIEVLLVKPFSDRDNWGIPKGHLDPGETHADCAIRETLEETGLGVDLGEPLLTVTCRFRRESKDVFSFLAQPTGDGEAIAADGENCEVRWWPIDGLPHVHRYQVPLFEDIVRKLSTRMDNDGSETDRR